MLLKNYNTKKNIIDCLRLEIFIFLNQYIAYYLFYIEEAYFNPYNKPLEIVFDGYEGISGIVFLIRVLLFFPGIIDLILLSFLFYRSYIGKKYFLVHSFSIYISQYIFSPNRIIYELPLNHPFSIGMFILYMVEFSFFAYLKNRSYKHISYI